VQDHFFISKEAEDLIEVRNLTKRYGSSTSVAVSDLSFTIEEGRIYGFLGPNGAGKTTTMNIITGCLGATEGSVKIDGHDIFDEPLEAKKLIGYLPELPPLYTDMTPYEYLKFVAQAKRVPKDQVEAQIEYACRKVNIVEMAFRLIKNLSKGYRQRVGIAQAIIGNPKVIILDEPTVGLDPAQVIEIRELIRELGKDHTVIFSSHILSEVAAVCDSVMIINKGQLVASGTTQELEKTLAGTSTTELEAMATEDEVAAILKEIPQVRSFEFKESDGTVKAVILSDGGVDIRQDVFNAFASKGKAILNLSRDEASLEDVFLQITQAANEPKGDE